MVVAQVVAALQLASLVGQEEVVVVLIMEEAYQFLVKVVMVEQVVDHPVRLALNLPVEVVVVLEDLVETLHLVAGLVG
jgi:hypothetical protein